MFFVDLIAWAIIIYLTFFIIYNLVVIFNSSRGRIYDIERKDYMSNFQQILTVIIYSHNNSHKVKEQIEALNKQDYDKGKYSINILLDNCDDENIKLLEIIGGTKLWRINTDVKPIGKFKALAWLFERILACENTNAFVFIDADSKLKADFLQKVNTSMHHHPVVVGEILKRRNKILNRIANFKNKIKNKVIKHGRFYTDLGNIIDSEIVAIRQEVLEKIKFKTTDYGFEEYEYSINLKKNDVPVYYSNDVAVIKNNNETLKTLVLRDYERRYKSIITFRNNVYLLFSKVGFGVKELVFSLLYPSNTVFVFFTLILMLINKNYPASLFSGAISHKFLIYLLGSKFITDVYSMITIRSGVNDYQSAITLLFLSPVIYMRSVFIGFLTNNDRKSIEKPEKIAKQNTLNYEKHTVDATVTNGKKELPCTLEIRKTDEYSQVVFMFKDKKLTSSKQPKINYAVQEIVDKLKAHGFALKICINCGYFHFTESTSAHFNGEKGYCLYNNFKNGSKEKEYSCVWDGCFNIIPNQARNYILQQLGVTKK